MPRPRNPIPIPRRHKGAAVVDVYQNGTRRTVTLGPWGSFEAKEEYDRLVARTRAGTFAPTDAPADLTINELLNRYYDFAERHYVEPDGTTSRSVDNLKAWLRKLRERFGALPAIEFGPKMLKALRGEWVAEGIVRKMVNVRTGSLKRVFKWAVSEELLPAESFQRLQTVEGLRIGRTAAADRAPVRPAATTDVDAAMHYMPEPVRALACLQVHSAARAGELVKLRSCDIDRTDPEVWTYTPDTHKGTWRGKSRTIYFGEKCREVLAPFILKAGSPEAYLFSPARAEAERNADRSGSRVTPLFASHRERNASKRPAVRKRPPRDRYTTCSYRRAIERACEKAGVPSFSPHRLRHLAATRARAEFGVDVARALCGHSLASVTEVYSREVDRKLAMTAAKKLG